VKLPPSIHDPALENHVCADEARLEHARATAAYPS